MRSTTEQEYRRRLLRVLIHVQEHLDDDLPLEALARIACFGEYGVVTHRGPYERLPETYAWLYGDWLPRSGREPAESPGFQHHHNNPRQSAQEDLLTEVYVPLKAHG